MNNIFLAHELLEWFNCPRKAYHTHKNGCNSLIQSSYFREHIRVIHSFTKYKNNSDYKTTNIDAHNLETAVTHTLETIQSRKHPRIIHGVLASNNISVYISYMHWHNSLKGWQIHIPTVSSGGVKQEYLQYSSFIKIVFHALSIPISKIFLSYYHHSSHGNSTSWLDSDITTKVDKYYAKTLNIFTNIQQIINSEYVSDESKWPPCNKQYCEQCGIEKKHQIDDVQTLRKATPLIDKLLAQDIVKITNIPHSKIPNSSVINRQIQAVVSNQPLFLVDEVQEFLDKLIYPRYYLDFEAFSTSVPYDYNSPYIQKAWSYTPFLFSLQWQNSPRDKIHTQLWSMLPGKNQILQMWNALKTNLLNAASIVVYGSQFENDMIQQLASASTENQIGDEILQKIVDLQQIFFNLSVYHPKQKGKISLKTIVPVWIQGDYSAYKVSEGIGANYYFTAMTDTTLNLFNDIKETSYISKLFSLVATIEDPTVTLQNIAEYCKYDTAVMIRLVAMLEKHILKNS